MAVGARKVPARDATHIDRLTGCVKARRQEPLLLVLPMVGWLFIAQDPDGTLATILSFIPPITPMIMVCRIAANPYLPDAHIAATILLMLVSVPAVMWGSAKIFRIGILMYGKTPSVKEMFRWIRYR